MLKVSRLLASVISPLVNATFVMKLSAFSQILIIVNSTGLFILIIKSITEQVKIASIGLKIMKRLIATGLSVMLLFATSNPASAQARHGKEVSTNQTVQNNTSSNTYRNLTPFHLVSLGYQGYLKNQGIPSYGAFISEYDKYQSSYSKYLVKAGIEARLLSPDTIMNQAYIHAVESQLLALNF